MEGLKKMIPYGRQAIDEDDINAVVSALKSDWLTTGPLVGSFEDAFCKFTSAKHSVAVSSGTAALHTAINALDIGPGDEIIVPSLTFAATSNAILYQGAKPVFADIDRDKLLIDPIDVINKITPNTKAVIVVDYAGNPCDYDYLRTITQKHGIYLVSDTCHAVGATYKGRAAGTLADLNCFSFHPVKHLTTAEGGMVTTHDEKLAKKMRIFRNHGITSDHRERESKGTTYYEMVRLGYNYRLSDLQCALGISQIQKLSSWIVRRNEIAKRYTQAFADLAFIELQKIQRDSKHAHHLYVVRVKKNLSKFNREEAIKHLRTLGIVANVHYPPVHLHPYYQEHLGTKRGMLPNTEAVYDELISIPMYPTLTDEDIERVISAIRSLGL